MGLYLDVVNSTVVTSFCMCNLCYLKSDTYASLLAQSVERETVNLEAVGSIPTQRGKFCLRSIGLTVI